MVLGESKLYNVVFVWVVVLVSSYTMLCCLGCGVGE